MTTPEHISSRKDQRNAQSKHLLLTLIIALGAIGAATSYERTETSLFEPIHASRFEKRPKSYFEVGRVPSPRYITEYLYRYHICGIEYSGRPLDAYRERKENRAGSATVYYNPRKPGSFLLERRPYVSKTCGLLLALSVFTSLVLVTRLFLDYANRQLSRRPGPNAGGMGLRQDGRP